MDRGVRSMNHAVKLLASVRGENPDDCFTERVGDDQHLFIHTPSHGFLCLGGDDNGYSEALEIARNSGYSFVSGDGLVYLEEDVDAPKFLSTYKGDK
jgi:hypothetical protein